MCMNKVCSGPYVHTYTWVSTHPYVPGLGKFIVDPRCAMCILPEMFLGCCEPSLALDISMGRPPSLWSYCPQCTTDHPATVQIQLAANTLLCKYISVQIHLSVNLSSNAAHNTTLASCRKPNDPVGAQHWLENIANTGSQIKQGLYTVQSGNTVAGWFELEQSWHR